MFSFAIVIAAAFLPLFLDVRYPMKYESLIRVESKRNGLDPSLVAAVIATESGYEEAVVSPKGAVGLMQIMPTTARYVCEIFGINFEPDRLVEPEYNVKIGCCYLRYLSARFSGVDVPAAYNAGEGNVIGWKETESGIPFRETREYVKRVVRAKRYYDIKYGSRG